MLKGIFIGVILTLALGVLTGYGIIRAGVIPATSDQKPPRLEEWAAKMSLRATIARNAPRGDNPLPLTDQNLIAGIKLYGQNCAICHGDSTGKPTNVAKGMYQRSPQLGRHGVEDDPDGETFWKVTHGIRWTAMPAFSRSLTETQIWQLTLFLKHMDSLPPAAHKVWLRVKA